MKKKNNKKRKLEFIGFILEYPGVKPIGKDAMDRAFGHVINSGIRYEPFPNDYLGSQAKWKITMEELDWEERENGD